MLKGIKRAVFFGAHTDDEMVCAGTLHRLVQLGCQVHVVTFAPAAIASDRTGGDKSAVIVLREWNQALDFVGVTRDNRHYVGLTPSSDFQPHRQKICQFVYDFCEYLNPDMVLTLSPDDENTAHSIVGVESERVLRGRVPYAVRCQFPWNYSIGRHNLFVELGPADLQCKADVIGAYKSQHFRYEYHDMFMSYARADGLSVKVTTAEKFELIRGVV